MSDDLEKYLSGNDDYVSKTDQFLEEMNRSLAEQVEEQSHFDQLSEETAAMTESEPKVENDNDSMSSSMTEHTVRDDTVLTDDISYDSTPEPTPKTSLPISAEEKERKRAELFGAASKPLTVSDYLEQNNENQKKKKLPLAAKIFIGFAAVLLVLGGAGAYYINFVLDHANIVDTEEERRQIESERIPVEEETFDQDEKKEDAVEIDPEEVLWEKVSKLARKEEDVVNILLVGEEDLGEQVEGRGRTDCMIIATISKKENSLKLTSLMRDMYVPIPGYSDNKLNQAYKNGGISLLKETIETNFGVAVDGYVLVDFASFEDVIDALGGVEIKLTKAEAEYLNTHNYISKKKYRNVTAGKQVLNGNQARGYSRIRYVATGNGLTDDWGRNYRQRKVLNAVFKEYKSKSIVELVAILPDILSLVTTDITKNEMLGYIGMILTIDAEKLETLSVPVRGSFTMPYINGMSVLLPNLSTNQEELHNFLFGDDDTAEAE